MKRIIKSLIVFLMAIIIFAGIVSSMVYVAKNISETHFIIGAGIFIFLLGWAITWKFIEKRDF